MNDRPFPDRPSGERMTEGQIEDVLSAIRRLVSDEALAGPRRAAPVTVNQGAVVEVAQVKAAPGEMTAGETVPVETLQLETEAVKTMPVETVPVETVPVETVPVKMALLQLSAALPPKLILTAAQRVHSAGGVTQALGRIGASVPAQGFESDIGDDAIEPAAWPTALWDAAPPPLGTVTPPPLGAAVPAAPAVRSEPAPPVDEARLRDLIREVLREELHGRMGERITTNVRKLVRVEINRLIALHDAQLPER